VLPLILASAALVGHPAKPKPVEGPAIEGWITNQAGKPQAAKIGLIALSQRGDVSFPSKVVVSAAVKSKKKVAPGYRIAAAPGLYLLDVRANGFERLQVPVLVGEDGLKAVDLTLRSEKAKDDAQAISSDAKLVKLEALYAAQVAREAKYQKTLRDPAVRDAKSAPVDWTADVEALAKELNAGTDADAQALAAACYLELGYMRAKLDPATASLALDKLPAKSPFWALNPRVAPTSFAAAARTAEWPAFREALAKDNPDAELRAYGYFAQLSSAASKGDKDKQKALFQTLTTEYKDTRFGKSAKQLDPDKTPVAAPVAAPAAKPEAPAAPAEKATPAPASEAVPAPSAAEAPASAEPKPADEAKPAAEAETAK